MKVEIDQSGKIEDTSKNTILCFSNDEWGAILIKARTKRQLQEVFRRYGQIRNYVLFTFSAGLSFLLKLKKKNSKVTIDLEYYGKDSTIKSLLIEMIGKKKENIDIEFGRIGKKSMAHHRAKAVAIGKLKAMKIVEYNDIMKVIKTTEVGKRLKNA